MSEKSTLNEAGYCADCGWLDAGDEHDWNKHPETIHGSIERLRRLYKEGEL